MRVKKLTLRNFRNIEECSLVPDSRLNFLIGSNGQGKTTILEALSFLSSLRSFRGAKTEEVIRWHQAEAEISCLLSPEAVPQGSTAEWETQMRVAFSSQPGSRATKVAFINGKPFRSSTQYLSQRFGAVELGFHIIVFNPADHDLIRGEPSLRRNYLDRVIAAEDVEYLETVQKYQRVLDQRNALLKTEGRIPRDLLAGFTEPLGRLASLLSLKRLKWLQRLNQRLNDIVHQIAPSQPDLRASYVSKWIPENVILSLNYSNLHARHFSGQYDEPSLELLEKAFWMQLAVLEEAELRARSTLTGPHRDDWALFLGDHPLRGHGSQGEVRSALLALKLSEIEMFQEQTGHQPLLLLDDFSSELDRERRAFLLGFLSRTDLQVFVTTTEDSSYAGKRYWVSQGNLDLIQRQEDKHDQYRTE